MQKMVLWSRRTRNCDFAISHLTKTDLVGCSPHQGSHLSTREILVYIHIPPPTEQIKGINKWKILILSPKGAQKGKKILERGFSGHCGGSRVGGPRFCHGWVVFCFLEGRGFNSWRGQPDPINFLFSFHPFIPWTVAACCVGGTVNENDRHSQTWIPPFW